MQTRWDYSKLATSYLKRPDYSFDCLKHLMGEKANVRTVCDVGAGVGHLTRQLLRFPVEITAVEPNDAMRALGIEHTDPKVRWLEGVGECTGLESAAFDLVTFGSSFNVTDRAKTLVEVARILRPGGIFACLWNHRYLEDPVQSQIEGIIKENIQGYSYGTRREDQTSVIVDSDLFQAPECFESKVVHEQRVDDVIEAWRSHATLARQAGERFGQIVGQIEVFLRGLGHEVLQVPYTTRMWHAKLK